MQSRVSIGQVMVKVRSAKQIEASKQNGSMGLGPVTEVGKQRSCLNAYRHGGYSNKYITLGEDPAEFEEYHQAMVDHWQPRNILESDLVEQFIFCAWKQRRLASMESAVLSTEMLDYYRSDLILDYRKTRKFPATYLTSGSRVSLSKNEELIAIAFKRDVNSHQSLMVLEDIHARAFSKYLKLLDRLIAIKQERHA